MTGLGFEAPQGRPLQVLCLGAHSDDIEIGCGGTLLRIAESHPRPEFHWVVFTAAGLRLEEAQRGAGLFGAKAELKGPTFGKFRDGFLPFQGHEVKQMFEDLKASVRPDIIFTHNRLDAHQDHRLLCELTSNTYRDHLILEYEIPKYDGDMGQPNFFVPLSTELVHQKINHIMEAFESQKAKRWFEPETFRSLMRLRGMECNAPSGYAEGFYCRKAVLR